MIEQLRVALADATAARDWDRLGAAERALAPQLSALARLGQWNAQERRALAELRAAHDQAAAVCAGAVQALERRLAELRANKDGWIAYALANDGSSA
jgi:hypothetical protein